MRIRDFDELSDLEKKIFLEGEPLHFSEIFGLVWYRDDHYKKVFIEDYDESFSMQRYLKEIFEYYQKMPTLDDYAGSDK